MNNGQDDVRMNPKTQLVQTSDESKSITLISLLLPILKRPWILGLSLVVVLVPLLYTLSRQSTFYKSSATIMVSVRETGFMDAISLVEGTRANIKSQNYYTSILESRAYRSDILAKVSIVRPNLQLDSLWSALKVGYDTSPREPGFITISAVSQSKEFALLLAETALSVFRERLVNFEREDAIHISGFINNQIKGVTEKLEKSEENLQSFLTSRKLVMVDVETGITRELFTLEQNLNEAKASLEMININIETYESQLNDLLDKLTYEAGTNDTRVNEIRSRLTEIRDLLNNPNLNGMNPSDIKSLELERDEKRNKLINLISPAAASKASTDPAANVTIQRVEEELESALIKQTDFRNQVRFYQIQIERFRREHPDLSADILKYASLSRAKSVLDKTLEILLEKQEEVRIRIESEMGGLKVIDEPRLPERPLAKNRLKKLLFGLFASLIVGVAFSMIIDYFDNTIKDLGDIQQNFGLTVFGTIPALVSENANKMFTKHSSNDPPPEVQSFKEGESKLLTAFSEKSPVAEAYRSNKIALQFLASDRSKKMFVVSSPSVSEGKSLTTTNLAISFAQGYAKTLLIDCDLRKPVQHKSFEKERKPGLVDYLYGEAELEDVIKNTGVPNLSIITAGSSSNNPAELLASQKMQDLLKDLRTKYDYILIDTPPILVCSDSRVLAEVTDGMILIVKVESTNLKALDHAISLTKHLDIEILGVILNQVSFRYGRGYYYAYRYYKPYSYYSGYYYKSQYYDYTENEGGEKVKVKRELNKSKSRSS